MARSAILMLLGASAAVAACAASAGGLTGEWHLVGLEGKAAPAPLSITFGEDGKVSGQAPCNRFFGGYSAELPAFALDGMGATRMACPELAAEAAYLEALSAMTGAELAEGRLFLNGPEGRVMEFARDARDAAGCLSCRPGQE